jgi:energy-coupling factor transporter ATP-binding protein EcfA2
MKFVSIRIHGLKRFGDPAILRIRGKTLAVLGHNESGKTSLIEAMAHVGRNGFAGATEFTDRAPRPPQDIILSARFEIEDADIAAITKALEGRSYSGGVQAGQQWTMSKHANGGRYINDVEGLQRDFSSRGRLVSTLDQIMGRWDSLPIHVHDEGRQSQIPSGDRGRKTTSRAARRGWPTARFRTGRPDLAEKQPGFVARDGRG